MTEPQVWVFMGLVAIFAFAAIGIVSANFTCRTLRTEVGALRAEMNARFDATDVKIAHIDADVPSLTRRVMGDRD